MMDNQVQSMMWLRRLSMTNYRKFGGRFSADANSNGGHSDSMVPGLTVDFDRQMTVLVGENGAGKTAVLDAAAVALGTFLKAFPEVSGLRIQGSDARRKYYSQYGETDIQEQFPVSIYAQADIAQPVQWRTVQERGNPIAVPIEWRRELNSANGSTTFSKASQICSLSEMYQKLVQMDPDAVLPLLAYYGTDRLGLHGRMTGKARASAFKNRFRGYDRCLQSSLNYRQMDAWWRKQYDRSLRGYDVPTYRAVCKTVERCLETLLRENGHATEARLEYDFDDGLRLSYTDSDGVRLESMPLWTLSDGYRGVVGLVSDIAWRIAALNPFMGDSVIDWTPGVVLIDEVDLHLHPKWQSCILGVLMKSFPQIQFIVTTHAPMVISSVASDRLRVITLDDKNDGIYQAVSPRNETYGSSASLVLRHVMGSLDKPRKVQDLFDRFSRQMDADEFPEAKQTLGELERTIGADNPDLSGARSSYFFYDGEVRD